MQTDIWKICLILLFGALSGWVVGLPWQGMLIAAIGVIAWQMSRLYKLYQWIRSPNNHPMPESTGQLHLLHLELTRKNRASRMRKKQLTKLFSQFRQAVSVLPDSIVLIDQIGQIRWANNNAERMFGIRWPADANLRFGNLVRDPKLEKLLTYTATSAAKVGEQLSETEQDLEESALGGIEINSTHDSEQVFNVKIIPYTSELRMVLARDVTRLMKVNQMHSDFVANVSHELKTPLTVLRGYLELLDSNPKLDESFQRPIAQMSVQSERMQMIVQDLLFLSKLEDKNKKLKLEVIDVTHLINSIVETIQPKVSERAHKLELDIDYQLRILGNPNELHSAFSNLIVNAVNYTPENGIIKVRWRQNDSMAELIVSDNGPGIAAHHLPRLTERFYRIDTDRSREGGGTGLGLAIVKHVVQRHDGKLEIDSVEGIGSTFMCRFPAHRLVSLPPQSEQQIS